MSMYIGKKFTYKFFILIRNSVKLYISSKTINTLNTLSSGFSSNFHVTIL